MVIEKSAGYVCTLNFTFSGLQFSDSKKTPKQEILLSFGIGGPAQHPCRTYSAVKGLLKPRELIQL